MFTHPCHEMVLPLPPMTDRVRYDIWRFKQDAANLPDTFNRMAWIGDDALKTQVTKYLYENTVDRLGADTELLHDLRETFECRWAQLVFTLALGLDEEMEPPLTPLVQGMGRLDHKLKAYADIFESYIGGLYSQDREAADYWISTLIRRFYRDLMKQVDRFLAPAMSNGHAVDVTCVRLHVDWHPHFGPTLEMRPRPPYRYAISSTTKPLLPMCFIMTGPDSRTRHMSHRPIDLDRIRRRGIPRDKFSESFRRRATVAPLTLTQVNPVVGIWPAAFPAFPNLYQAPFEPHVPLGFYPLNEPYAPAHIHSAPRTEPSTGTRAKPIDLTGADGEDGEDDEVVFIENVGANVKEERPILEGGCDMAEVEGVLGSLPH